MKITENQARILSVLVEGNPDGSIVDLDQLLDRLRVDFHWATTKPSLQFSLRQLIKAGLVNRLGQELRRQRNRRLLQITDLGRSVMG
jgi:DNA-binding PadR family transcriptional regulator